MVVRFARVLPWPPALLVVACLAAPASAQRAVISVAGPGLAPVTDLVDMATGAVTHLSNDATDTAVFLSDGAILLRHASGEPRWRARFMDAGVEVALPEEFAPVYGGPPNIVVAHPREAVVFGLYRLPPFGIDFPARVDATGLRGFQPCGDDQRYASLDVSSDGRQLFILCTVSSSPSSTSAVVVIDSVSGAVVRRVPLGSAPASSIVLDTTATEVVVLRAGVGAYAIERRDAVSGSLLLAGAFTWPGGSLPMLVPNPRRRDQPHLVRCADTGGTPPVLDCTTHVVDAQSLTIGVLVQASGPRPPTLSFSADGRETVVSGTGFVSRVDATTGATLNYVAAPAGGFIVAAWGAEPQAPVLAPAIVTGATVALSWTLPTDSPAATGYRLEVGSRPGVANILTEALGSTPSLTAASVPPGRYYVRLRAVNGNGGSQASNEVAIDVP